jgi:hypothetical protein
LNFLWPASVAGKPGCDGGWVTEADIPLEVKPLGIRHSPLNLLTVPEEFPRQFVRRMVGQPNSGVGPFFHGTIRVGATHIRSHPTRTHRVDRNEPENFSTPCLVSG